MFEFIRKHTKWMMVLLFALIIPSFVFFGIDNYQSMNSAANATVAVVDGQKITQAEWDEAHRQEADRLRAILYVLVEGLRLIAVQLYPFVPRTSEKIWAQLGNEKPISSIPFEALRQWGFLQNVRVTRGENLFPKAENRA